MTDTDFWGRVLFGCLILWATAALIAAALCRAAARPAPMPHPEDLWGAYFDGGPLPTLADRLEAAHAHIESPVVAEAQRITRAATRSTS